MKSEVGGGAQASRGGGGGCLVKTLVGGEEQAGVKVSTNHLHHYKTMPKKIILQGYKIRVPT